MRLLWWSDVISVHGPRGQDPGPDSGHVPDAAAREGDAVRHGERLDLRRELRIVGLGEVGLAAVAGDVQACAHEPPVGVHVER